MEELSLMRHIRWVTVNTCLGAGLASRQPVLLAVLTSQVWGRQTQGQPSRPCEHVRGPHTGRMR